MYSHQLKTRIAAVVFLAVIVAMILIDAVAFALIYHYQIKQRVQVIERFGENLAYFVPELNVPVLKEEISLTEQRMKVMIGEDCEEFLIFSKSVLDSDGSPTGINFLRNLVKEAVTAENTKIRTMHNEALAFIGFSKKLFIGIPLRTADIASGNGSGVGVIINTSGLFDDLWQKQKIVFAYILLNGIIISTVVFFRLRKVLFDPVEHLVHLANNYQVAEGGGLFPETPDNEFGQLHKAMNSMVQRIEEDRGKLFQTVNSLEESNTKLQRAQDDVVRAEKMAAAGRLSAGLAHEIGNPVTIVQGYLELLQHSDISDEDRKEFAQRGLGELTRIDRLLQQLLNLTRTAEEASEPVNLRELLTEVRNVLNAPFTQKGIIASLSYPEEDIFVLGDREQLRQVLLNLLLNSMDALDSKNLTSEDVKKTVSLTIKRQESEENIMVEVHDNGIGIPESDLSKIFEPFFTSKEPGKGTGLGLAVSYRFIEKIGGRLEVESTVDDGTSFRIILPVFPDKSTLHEDEV